MRFCRNLPALKMPNTQETRTPDHPMHVQLRVYALAMLLAGFISALHAGILFGLADFSIVFREWVKPALGPRPTDILGLSLPGATKHLATPLVGRNTKLQVRDARTENSVGVGIPETLQKPDKVTCFDPGELTPRQFRAAAFNRLAGTIGVR
jgi:hypothetical protein